VQPYGEYVRKRLADAYRRALQTEFAEHNFPDTVVRKIMLDNAKRVRRLEQG
jgi:hypothetical protein